MSKTPETDANLKVLHPGVQPSTWYVQAEFARRLERERDEALAALRELMMDCDHLLLECPWHTREWADGVRKMQDHARALLARVEEEK